MTDAAPAPAETTPVRPVVVLLALVTVALAAWLAYQPALQAGFRHDDFWWLRTAKRWADGTLPLSYAPAGVAPVYNLLYYATYRAGGLDPWLYFAELLACHAVNSCLVLVLLWLLTGRLRAAWAGGLCFALLFCHHEAVTWPAGGPHVFAACGILLSLIGWVRWRQGCRRALPLALACAVLAVFTKDSGIAVVPLLFGLEVTVYRAADKRALAWLLLPPLALVTWRLAMPPIAEPMAPGSVGFRAGWHMLPNLVYAVPQMVWPDLRFDNYQALLHRALAPGAVALVLRASDLVLLALSVVAAIILVRSRGLLQLAVAWCYLGFAPYTPFAYGLARAPRYLYIPSIGLALLAALAVDWLAATGRRATLVALAVVFLLGSFGFARWVCRNRLRDSALRDQAVDAVLSEPAVQEFGGTVCLYGLPEYLQDVAEALPLYSDVPIQALTDPPQPPPGAWAFRFAPQPPYALIERGPVRH